MQRMDVGKGIGAQLGAAPVGAADSVSCLKLLLWPCLLTCAWVEGGTHAGCMWISSSKRNACALQSDPRLAGNVKDPVEGAGVGAQQGAQPKTATGQVRGGSFAFGDRCAYVGQRNMRTHTMLLSGAVLASRAGSSSTCLYWKAGIVIEHHQSGWRAFSQDDRRRDGKGRGQGHRSGRAAGPARATSTALLWMPPLPPGGIQSERQMHPYARIALWRRRL